MGIALADSRLDRALSWARLKVDFSKKETLRSSPWGTTLRLATPTATFFLKIFPTSQKSLVESTAAIAQIAGGSVARVIAKDALNGFLLSEDHGGHIRASGSDAATYPAILNEYARIQAAAASESELLASVERFTSAELMARVSTFLTPGPAAEGNEARLSDFFGLRYSGLVAEALTICRKPIERLMQQAEALPATINHCDLHTGNVGFDAKGACKFHDWDNAMVGPAGLSLSGLVTSVAELLAAQPEGSPARTNPSFSLLKTYAAGLEAEGYASAPQTLKVLAGSALAGLLVRLVNYMPFRPASEQERQLCVGDLGRITSDILDCCQILASRDRKRLSAFSGLLSRHQHYDKLFNLILSAGFDQAVEREGGLIEDATSKAAIEYVERLAKSYRRAQEPDSVPVLATTPQDWLDEGLFNVQANVATQMFSEHGALALVNAFPPQLLSQCLSQYMAIGGGGSGIPLKVGDKRHMEALSVQGAFNQQQVYAQPLLTRMFQRLLGPDFTIGSMTIVVSEPGSETQHLHIDHPHLFGDNPAGSTLPPHAVTVLIPLVDIDEEIGGTEIVKGSHRVPFAEGKQMPHQRQTLPLGGCLMFDYRTFHGGLPNRSTRNRPVLSIVYHRAWFKDSSNFSRLHPLQIPRAEFDLVPEHLRNLFQNALISPEARS